MTKIKKALKLMAEIESNTLNNTALKKLVALKRSFDKRSPIFTAINRIEAENRN